MRRRLLVVVSGLVILPALAVVLLAGRMVDDRAAVARVELAGLLAERLEDVERALLSELAEVEARLTEGLGAAPLEPDALRRLRRSSGLIGQVFVLDASGRLAFPPDDSTRSRSEARFVERTQEIWKGRAILYDPPAPEPSRAPSSKLAGDAVPTLAARRPHGWITWYWKDGLRLLFWRRAPGGGVIGAEVERVVLLARILGRLPALPVAEDRVVLTDPRGDPVQQWGPYEPPADAEAAARRRLPYPLDGFSLAYHLAPARSAALVGDGPWAVGFGVAGLLVALVGLGVYAYRESSRQIREAAQRVSFVTQVSHELKTPLSNIRLYAELLEADLEDDDTGAADRVGVIVSESQRLGRLIDNVLVFAKVRRGTHRVEPAPMVADEAVRRVLAQFAPALDAKGIEVRTDLSAPHPCRADPDAVEQILANLVSNVDKYAAGGGVLEVRTRQDATGTRIVVGDRGPGIPAAARARIFEPFYRVSDALSDGVTGTGIGLAIARSLAQQTGGRLELLADEGGGAWFELLLATSQEAT